jgi:hypothetical protein
MLQFAGCVDGLRAAHEVVIEGVGKRDRRGGGRLGFGRSRLQHRP